MRDGVGELKLGYAPFAVKDAPGQLLVAYRPEPESPSERALTLLAGIAADADAPAVHATA